jgi:uncharacterized phage-associated protein
MTSAQNLALWIRANLSARCGGLTHLKLQKLVFYTYGAALALNVDHDIGTLEFDAWEHGPVNRSVWQTYRNYGATKIPGIDEESPRYAPKTEQVLRDALTVYGPLDAWTLRQQSHLEAPWAYAHENQTSIDPSALRDHFVEKLGGPAVALPEYLAHSWNFSIDRLPLASFRSLRELADAVSRSRS